MSAPERVEVGRAVLREVHAVDRDERADDLRQPDDLGDRRHRCPTAFDAERARDQLRPSA